MSAQLRRQSGWLLSLLVIGGALFVGMAVFQSGLIDPGMAAPWLELATGAAFLFGASRLRPKRVKAVAAFVLGAAGLAMVAVTQLATLSSVVALTGLVFIVAGAVAGFLDLDDVRRSQQT